MTKRMRNSGPAEDELVVVVPLVLLGVRLAAVAADAAHSGAARADHVEPGRHQGVERYYYYYYYYYRAYSDANRASNACSTKACLR